MLLSCDVEDDDSEQLEEAVHIIHKSVFNKDRANVDDVRLLLKKVDELYTAGMYDSAPQVLHARATNEALGGLAAIAVALAWDHFRKNAPKNGKSSNKDNVFMHMLKVGAEKARKEILTEEARMKYDHLAKTCNPMLHGYLKGTNLVMLPVFFSRDDVTEPAICYLTGSKKINYATSDFQKKSQFRHLI